MKPIIDPHLHFFALDQGHYHWLKEDQAPFWSDKHILRHPYHEASLTLSPGTRLMGFVHIEAGFDNQQPWREIAWLESSCTLPFKSVAGIDLTLEPDAFIEQIQALLKYQSVVGCRHILDDEAYELLTQQKVKTNLAYLANQQLSFDLQMSLRDTPAITLLVAILDDLPGLRVIINHAGWPPLNNESKTEAVSPWQVWQENLFALSQFEQCAIKCSGWEMADRQYTKEWQLKVISACLEAFGGKRVMLASNFPLVLFTQAYDDLWNGYLTPNTKISEEQISALTCENAAYWYKLKV